jgi:aspartyl-tRNA(Asn)/glutamyl-tRNA(Gln) amidotransferase subunit C
MHEICQETIAKLSGLCHIECTPSELDQFFKDLRLLISYMDCIQSINTDSVPPYCHYDQTLSWDQAQAHMYADIPGNTLSRQSMLANAPQHTEEVVVIPFIDTTTASKSAL